MKRNVMAAWLLSFAAAFAEEAPATFTVLKVSAGDEVSFHVVAGKDAVAERERVFKESEKALADWSAKKADFLKDKNNKGKSFPDPKPELAMVGIAKDKIATEEEAKSFAAVEMEKALGGFSVVRVAGCDGSSHLEVMRESKVNGKKAALRAEYRNLMEQWQKRSEIYAETHKKDKKKVPFGDPKPSTPGVEHLKKDLPTQEEADKAKEELGKAEKPKK